jgi:hypothetical protein
MLLPRGYAELHTDSNVDHLCVARALSGMSFMRRWKVGLAPVGPAYRKRRRRALVAERKSRRRERTITARRSRSELAARRATLPLTTGPALIVILLLSLGLWAMIWAAVALALGTLG